MIASIIPNIRTPRNVSWFDYLVPEGMHVHVGDLVRIPFRKAEAVGLVHSLRENAPTTFEMKFLTDSYDHLSLSRRTVGLLDALADRSYSSHPNILHSWLGILPKRKRDMRSERMKNSTPSIVHEIVHHYLLSPHTDSEGLLARARRAQQENASCLILTPWASRAKKLAQLLGAPMLTSEAAAGARFTAWSDFIHGRTILLVSTRIGSWLSTEADIVLIEEPENDDHKQDELSPRYDARWIATYAAQHGTVVETFGITPSLKRFAEHNEQHLPEIHTPFIAIDTHRTDWSPISGIQQRTLIEIERAQEDKRAIYIIHPIHGQRGSIRCADCTWTLACQRCGTNMHLDQHGAVCLRCHHRVDGILSCPNCSSTNLSRSKPGRDRLASDLIKHGFNDVHVLSLKEWNDIDDLPKGSLVILTDLQLLAGSVEDLRTEERMLIHFRRAAAYIETKESVFLVQAIPELLMRAKTWLTAEGVSLAYSELLRDREAFGLPPRTRLIKLILRGNEGYADRLLETLRASLPNTIRVEGPYTVPLRPAHRSPRFIGHVFLPAGIPFDSIRNAFIPIQNTDTIIDLDPIAFFE